MQGFEAHFLLIFLLQRADHILLSLPSCNGNCIPQKDLLSLIHGGLGLFILFLLQDGNLGIAHQISKEVENAFGLNKQEEWMY